MGLTVLHAAKFKKWDFNKNSPCSFLASPFLRSWESSCQMVMGAGVRITLAAQAHDRRWARETTENAFVFVDVFVVSLTSSTIIPKRTLSCSFCILMVVYTLELHTTNRTPAIQHQSVGITLFLRDLLIISTQTALSSSWILSSAELYLGFSSCAAVGLPFGGCVWGLSAVCEPCRT